MGGYKRIPLSPGEYQVYYKGISTLAKVEPGKINCIEFNFGNIQHPFRQVLEFECKARLMHMRMAQ